jgi:hypothetical protein
VHSRADGRAARALRTGLLGAWLCGAAFAEPDQPAAAPSAALSDDALAAAVARVRQDPDVGGEKKTKQLHWISDGKKSETPDARPVAWLIQFFDYLAQTANLLLWITGIVAAGFVGLGVYRFLRARGPRAEVVPLTRATRVGGLDIRPDSLPDDVAAAARALLEAGRTREALSLLYRGALSRAVHGYGVPIGESFTEGEVLREVGQRLDAPRVQYFDALVRLWQRAVYAGERTGVDAVASLCTGFGSLLGGGAQDTP